MHFDILERLWSVSTFVVFQEDICFRISCVGILSLGCFEIIGCIHISRAATSLFIVIFEVTFRRNLLVQGYDSLRQTLITVFFRFVVVREFLEIFTLLDFYFALSQDVVEGLFSLTVMLFQGDIRLYHLELIVECLNFCIQLVKLCHFWDISES